MKKLLLLLAMGVTLFSCKDQSKMYTEQELRKAVNDAKYDQKMADIAEYAEAAKNQELRIRAEEAEKRNTTSPPFGYFHFGVIRASYSTSSGTQNVIYTTDVQSTKTQITEEDEYRLLDQLASTPSFKATRSTYSGFRVNKREVLKFITYAQASEKREQILSEN